MTETSAGGRGFRYQVDVRFRDLDALGHAHHALALMYVEEARAQLWRELTGHSAIDGIDYVLAEVAVRYHAPIFYPARLDVELNVTRVGMKSIEMEFAIRSPEGDLLTSGNTVQVMYDYATRTSKPLDDDLRGHLEAFTAESAEDAEKGRARR